MSSTIKSKYKVFESTSPYSKKGRYEEPKEIFKEIIKEMKKFKPENEIFSVVDIGCANGEFLYFLNQSFSKAKLKGYDATESFIKNVMIIIAIIMITNIHIIIYIKVLC